MMETKLHWIAFCALLVINLGTAENDGAASPTPESAVGAEPAPVDPVAKPVPDSSHNLTSQTLNGSDANPSPTGNGSLSININETISVTHDDPYNSSHPATSAPQGTTTPMLPPPDGHSTISHTSPSPTSTSTTLTAINSLTTVPSPNHTTSHQTTALPANSPKQPSENATSVPVPPQTTTHTVAGTQVSSTVAATPSHENPTSQPTTNNSQSHGQPGASSETTPTSSTSTQAKTHSDMPSQLNVEGDTTMVHDSPALDPLLAGLVSAFIITAVIITLLLFLKLRRRDNRPEFRRLQDLPMDDMMEDTPLSMYSY